MSDNNSTMHTVKRNSLSSKWGVWAAGSDANSPVEKLLAEFKNSEDAETYRDRVEAGEDHTAIIASLGAKKSKTPGGGVFGKLFKRNASADINDGSSGPVVNNPVIEIQAPVKKEDEDSSDSAEAPAKAQPTAVKETPSRFQVIEQPAPEPVKPVVTETAPPAPDVVAEVEQEEAAEPAAEEQVSAQVDQMEESIKEEAIVSVPDPEEVVAEQVEAVVPELVSEEPVAEPPVEKPVAEQVEVIEAAPVVEKAVAESTVDKPAAKTAVKPASNATPEDSNRDDGLLVDWTFTPPPDVTPEEVRSSSGAQVATEVQTTNAVDPEWAAPAAKSGPATVESESARGIVQDPGTGRITVEICVSKALKDSSAGDPRVSDKKYNSIASKEYTEVSKAFAAGSSSEHLSEELTHLAAVCLAWAEAIAKRQATETENIAA